MRRFWQLLAGKPRRSRPVQRSVRPSFEGLEDRWQPSSLSLTSCGLVTYEPSLTVQPTRYTFAMPSPTALVGKSVQLGFFPSETLAITSMQPAAAGSHTFGGTYKGHAVTGQIGAAQWGGPLLTTASIFFRSSWTDASGAQHRLEYAGTLNQNWTTATTWGTITEAWENTGLAAILYGPWYNAPPESVSGTFV